MKFNRRVGAAAESAWQVRFTDRGITRNDEAWSALSGYFGNPPELGLLKASIEGVTSEAEAQQRVERMIADLKSKGVTTDKVEARVEERFTLSPRDIVEVIRILVDLRNGRGEIDDMD